MEPGADGLPAVAHPFQSQAMITAAMRASPMPADAFAEAALRQIDRSRAVIVSRLGVAFLVDVTASARIYDSLARKQWRQTLAQLDARTVTRVS